MLVSMYVALLSLLYSYCTITVVSCTVVNACICITVIRLVLVLYIIPSPLYQQPCTACMYVLYIYLASVTSITCNVLCMLLYSFMYIVYI